MKRIIQILSIAASFAFTSCVKESSDCFTDASGYPEKAGARQEYRNLVESPVRVTIYNFNWISPTSALTFDLNAGDVASFQGVVSCDSLDVKYLGDSRSVRLYDIPRSEDNRLSLFDFVSIEDNNNTSVLPIDYNLWSRATE